tara:strand:+ start:152 stop:403 length:252 start_codon:yes stop_codon:yes gene_type:complete
MALSKTQSARLGSFLAVVFNEDVPTEYMREIVEAGYVEKCSQGYRLTSRGLNEKNRLCALIGLNVKYLSEKKAPPERGNSPST